MAQWILLMGVLCMVVSALGFVASVVYTLIVDWEEVVNLVQTYPKTVLFILGIVLVIVGEALGGAK